MGRQSDRLILKQHLLDYGGLLEKENQHSVVWDRLCGAGVSHGLMRARQVLSHLATSLFLFIPGDGVLLCCPGRPLPLPS